MPPLPTPKKVRRVLYHKPLSSGPLIFRMATTCWRRHAMHTEKFCRSDEKGHLQPRYEPSSREAATNAAKLKKSIQLASCL